MGFYFSPKFYPSHVPCAVFGSSDASSSVGRLCYYFPVCRGVVWVKNVVLEMHARFTVAVVKFVWQS